MRKEAIQNFWHRYEIPIVLVSTAFAVVIFLYANFLTKDDGQVLDMRITRSNEARIREDTRIREEVKEALGRIEAAQAEERKYREEDRKILIQILKK